MSKNGYEVLEFVFTGEDEEEARAASKDYLENWKVIKEVTYGEPEVVYDENENATWFIRVKITGQATADTIGSKPRPGGL